MDQKPDQLKFVVLDEEDLEIVSAHLQDAVVKVADVLWRPQENRVVVAVNRFDWEGAQTAKPEYRRRRSALRLSISTTARNPDSGSTGGADGPTAAGTAVAGASAVTGTGGATAVGARKMSVVSPASISISDRPARPIIGSSRSMSAMSSVTSAGSAGWSAIRRPSAAGRWRSSGRRSRTH